MRAHAHAVLCCISCVYLSASLLGSSAFGKFSPGKCFLTKLVVKYYLIYLAEMIITAFSYENFFFAI